jgi:hypothetical protein
MLGHQPILGFADSVGLEEAEPPKPAPLAVPYSAIAESGTLGLFGLEENNINRGE